MSFTLFTVRHSIENTEVLETHTVLIAATHNIYLVVASIAVSLVAAFTGLALTNNIAKQPESKRKALVVMSAFILGSGIWSMHFVAMLAHEFSITVYYDPLQTLGSALVAILVVGVALLMLHFSHRTVRLLNMAGLLLGLGVVVMHYTGMLAIRGVIPHFSPLSVVLAMLVACVTGMVAIRVAYGKRTKQNIVLGAVVFGLAVVTVHYAAMFGTQFHPDNDSQLVPLAMANHTLAIAVTVASFLICGSFLLATTSFITQNSTHIQSDAQTSAKNLPAIPATATTDTNRPAHRPGQLDQSPPLQAKSPAAEQQIEHNLTAALGTVEDEAKPELQIPFEQNKKIHYVDSSSVGAIRADGHYTYLYTKAGVRFCPWPINEAEKRLSAHNFHRTHRSYLINILEIESFEKRKESGVCLFKNYPKLSSVPVSRNRVLGVVEVLKQAHQSKKVGV